MIQTIASIVHELRKLCHLHRVSPDHIKITIEFTDPGSQNNAECALRMTAGPTTDPRLIDSVCNEREFRFMGFTFEVKKFVFATPTGCPCFYCRGLRNHPR